MAFSGRMKELVKKYGKVALGVHFSVSAVSITGLYVAIKNNVDVESIFHRVGLSSGVKQTDPAASAGEGGGDGYDAPPLQAPLEERTRNRTAELAASSGGALALAVLCNKALFPVRVPITIALTPPIARFLARRKLLKMRD